MTNVFYAEGYDNQRLRNKFIASYKRVGYFAINRMKGANNDIWMCDRDFYVKGI